MTESTSGMDREESTAEDEQAKRLAIIQRVVWRETVEPELQNITIEDHDNPTPSVARFVSDLLVATLMGTPGYSSTIIGLCEQEEGFTYAGD